MRPLVMFVHLTKQTIFLVRARSFIKRTNTNELPPEWFTNCSLNVQFVCSPNCILFSKTKRNTFYIAIIARQRWH
ncbi:hypothetical protein Hanom_Chr15g01387061 [Helianthus anomalus]